MIKQMASSDWLLKIYQPIVGLFHFFLLNVHLPVGLETANSKVSSLEKNINTLEVEKRKQKAGKYLTA